MSEIANAQIDGTSLGFEDHGFFTANLYFDAGSWHIGLGSYIFDQYDKDKARRIDTTGMGTEFIKRILETLEVDKWESLKGKFVRIETEGVNAATKVVGVGHLIKDQWFRPQEFFEEYNL